MNQGTRITSLGPECPECGVKSGKAVRSGSDEEGRPIRERLCRECNARYTTVEFVVPGVNFYNLDVERKLYQKLYQREKRGYWGQKARKFPVIYKLQIAFRVMAGPKPIVVSAEISERGRQVA